MKPAFDVKTQKTLLEKLRVFDDNAAWMRFMDMYQPMMQAWCRRFGFQDADVEELTARLLAKLVSALPQFDYDPEKGRFRGWLKTMTHREISNLARERRRHLPSGGLMWEAVDDIDDLVDSLHAKSAEMLKSFMDAVKEVEKEFEGEERKSWEMFQRIFLAGQEIKTIADEFGVSYHAAAMRVQRIKKKVRTRALELAVSRGVEP